MARGSLLPAGWGSFRFEGSGYMAGVGFRVYTPGPFKPSFFRAACYDFLV